jgi:hypothetical protein
MFIFTVFSLISAGASHYSMAFSSPDAEDSGALPKFLSTGALHRTASE